MDCKLVDDVTKKRRAMITRELLKMRQQDENAILRQRAKMKDMKKLAIEALCNAKIINQRPTSMLTDLAGSNRHDRRAVLDETKLVATGLPSLQKPRSRKFDSKVVPKVESPLSLVANFWKSRPMQNIHLPENIRRELTSAEISDLRMVFGLFDVKNRGYIAEGDLKMAIGLLGFPVRRGDVKDTIYETCKNKRGRIAFKHFLQLIVKLQNDGADPVEEIVQFFRLLDQGGKGYVTFADVKNTADELKIGLSNREIGDMVQEADRNGDGRVSVQELLGIAKQMGRFM